MPVDGDHRPMAFGLVTAGEGRARIIPAFAARCRNMIRDGAIPGWTSRRAPPAR